MDTLKAFLVMKAIGYFSGKLLESLPAPLIQSSFSRRHTARLYVVVLFVASVCSAQMTTLQTGGSSPSITGTEQLTIGTGRSPATIDLNAGFATDEGPRPGLFPDSFTITLQDFGQSGQTNTFVISTIDLYGALPNPSSPPGITAAPGEIAIAPISDPNEVLGYAQRFSFDVRFSPPAQFAGEDAVLYFDLFDNQQAPGSIAWFTPVSAVPEPGVLKFLALALALGFCCLQKRNLRA